MADITPAKKEVVIVTPHSENSVLGIVTIFAKALVSFGKNTSYDDQYGSLTTFSDQKIVPDAACKNAAKPSESDIRIAAVELMKSGTVMDNVNTNTAPLHRKEYDISPIRNMCKNEKVVAAK
ncbi:MAG: hypothetical protein V4735_02620 [Pseudomonadota bacterium]